jgi:hypothetical protein
MRQRPADLCRVSQEQVLFFFWWVAQSHFVVVVVVVVVVSLRHYYSWLTSSVAPQDDSTSARKKNTVKTTRTVNLGTGPRRGGQSSSGTHQQERSHDRNNAHPTGNSSALTARTFNNSGQVDNDDGVERHARRRTNANATINHIYDPTPDDDLDEL